jgi:hypothetical protein
MLITKITKGLDMGAVMKNADLRFTYVEHPFSMLIAAVLMTIINKKFKTTEKLTIPIMSLGLVELRYSFLHSLGLEFSDKFLTI